MNTFERIKVLIEDIKPEADVKMLKRTDNLKRDLELDSLDLTLLMIVIEDEFNLSLSNELTFNTVGDICDCIDDVRCAF